MDEAGREVYGLGAHWRLTHGESSMVHENDPEAVFMERKSCVHRQTLRASHQLSLVVNCCDFWKARRADVDFFVRFFEN